MPRCDAAAVVPASRALEHLGEEVVVEGGVDSVVCSAQACLLSFEPGFSGLVVAIPGDARAAFPDPDATYEARRVRVRGTVQDRGGRPRIEVRDPGAIELADPGAAASAAAPPGGALAPSRPASSQPASLADADAGPRRKVEVTVENAPAAGARLSAAEAAARLGLGAAEDRRGDAAAAGDAGLALGAEAELRLLRQELAALVSRLAAVEERLEELDERTAAVEDFAAAASAPREEARPGLPSFIVSGTVSPSLHRVRTGWSAERVLRVLGEPMQVVGRPPGPFTWYYDGGRAVTIDENARVVSTVGF